MGNTIKMADLMWGGVPRILPSDTCLKYQNDVKNKVLREKDLPTGSHLRATRILEGIRGFKQCKKDLSESYDIYYKTLKRLPRDPMQQLVIPENKRKLMLQFQRDRRPGTGLGLKTAKKGSLHWMCG